MIKGIFSLRNFVKKQLLKVNDEGIMRLPDKGQIDFGEMMIRENLFKRGIDVNSVTSEKQLESILNTPLVEPKVVPKKSGEVIEVDFDKGRWNKAGGGLAKKLIQEIIRKYKGRVDDRLLNQMLVDDNPQRLAEVMATVDEALIMQQKGMKPNQIVETVKESFKRKKQAQGGRTGLSYLLAEDSNQRVPFKLGGINKMRRAFLKAIGAGAATAGAAKTGLFGLLKGGAKKEVIKDLTQVPIKNGADGMPSWFKPLVNRVIKEGEEVESGAERVIMHKTQLPNSKTDVYVEQNLNTGDVVVDIGTGKHGFADGHLGQPVRLEYKASEVIEPSTTGGGYMTKGGENVYPGMSKGALKTEETTGKGMKTKEEFNVEEAEFTGGHPENVKFEESTIEKFGDHGSNFDEVEMFATGKVKKVKPTKKKTQTEFESGKAEADAERWTDEAREDVDFDDLSSDDFASGGRAGYVLGGKVGIRILKLLKDKKKVKEAYDNIFPTGDYKYDAEMVAESLVENNPKVFGNRLYEDLTDRERMAVYGAGLDEASTNFAKQLKMKRAMDKASRPTKTLEGIEKTGTIDISDDAVAEEFTNFMKETDPVGYSKIQKVVDDANQQLELKRFKTKGRKKNASGGLANMLGE